MVVYLLLIVLAIVNVVVAIDRWAEALDDTPYTLIQSILILILLIILVYNA